MKPRTLRRIFRRWLLTPLSWTLAAAAPPLLVAGLNARAKMAGLYPAVPPAPAAELPAPPLHDPSRPTAVVLLSNGLTEATDFLAPYELLSASGAYNVYAVAPERVPSPLFPGELDVLPHLSFAEYEARIGAPPAVLVIPYMEQQGQGPDPVVSEWIARQWSEETILLTICGGSYNVAQAGLLGGRRATSHANVLLRVTSEHPEVSWVQGQRWVDDGNLISSAGITSGVDATLYLLARELGRDRAERLARELGYPHTHFLDDPSFELPQVSAAPTYLNALYSGFTEIGVVLFPGAGEIALAALTDSYPRSYAARLRTLAPERGFVATRHGLQLVPRWSLGEAPELDRVLVAGAPQGSERDGLERWAEEQRLVLEAAEGTGYPYDTALVDVARRHSTAVALDAARGLEYPAAQLELGRAGAPPVRPLIPPVLLALTGVGAALLVRRGWRRWRGMTPLQVAGSTV